MFDRAPEQIAEALGKGDEVWSYNALVQDNYSPKWEIDFAPINYCIQPGFLSQSLGLTGILYWRIDLWTADPWHYVQTYRKGNDEYPGEGMLVYPGEQIGLSGVVPSMRLKWLRDGVEDYEYLELLKQLGCGQQGIDLAHNAAVNWSQWTHDPATLEQVRQQIGNLIVEAKKQPSRCNASEPTGP